MDVDDPWSDTPTFINDTNKQKNMKGIPSLGTYLPLGLTHPHQPMPQI